MRLIDSSAGEADRVGADVLAEGDDRVRIVTVFQHDVDQSPALRDAGILPARKFEQGGQAVVVVIGEEIGHIRGAFPVSQIDGVAVTGIATRQRTGPPTGWEGGVVGVGTHEDKGVAKSVSAGWAREPGDSM